MDLGIGIIGLCLLVHYIHNNSETVDITGRNYTCHYSNLHCSCWSQHSGCELGCESGIITTLYNQTECRPVDNLILAGFV